MFGTNFFWGRVLPWPPFVHARGAMPLYPASEERTRPSGRETQGTNLAQAEKGPRSVKNCAERELAQGRLTKTQWERGEPIRGKRSPPTPWPEHCSAKLPRISTCGYQTLRRGTGSVTAPLSWSSACSSPLSLLFHGESMSPAMSLCPSHMSRTHFPAAESYRPGSKLYYFLVHIL